MLPKKFSIRAGTNLTKTNKTVRQKANSWVTIVTTKTANQPKLFSTSQKPPGTIQSQLAIVLGIVTIGIINTIILFLLLFLLVSLL